MKKLNSEIYKIDEIYNFRDLVNHSASKYSNNVAYKFKKNLGKPNQKIVEKTNSGTDMPCGEKMRWLSAASSDLWGAIEKEAEAGIDSYEAILYGAQDHRYGSTAALSQ